ncbi:MAG: hypothetical protein WCI18_10015 [Pseudomonadota bacterium]
MEGNPGPIKRVLNSISKLAGPRRATEDAPAKVRQYPDNWGFWDEVLLHPTQNEAKVDMAFEALRESLFSSLDQQRTRNEGPSPSSSGFVCREFGRINGGRRYFYIKGFNQTGWLFERIGLGWTLSPAEKIADRSLFIRHGDSFDVVSVLEASGGSERFRLRSERWNIDHLSLEGYSMKCAKALGLNG